MKPPKKEFSIDYLDYLKSEKWKQKRKRFFALINFCEVCGRIPKARTRRLHHLTYKNLGNEPQEDLLATCNGCHNFIENAKTSGEIDTSKLQTSKERYHHTITVVRPKISYANNSIPTRHYWGGEYGLKINLNPKST